MRLAFFSPFNPQRSGISDYSEELLPYLARQAQIDLFVDGFRPANQILLDQFQWFDYRTDPTILNRLSGYDAIVYHMGNDHRYHAGIYDTARSFPGIIVFHDFALQTFFFELARERREMRIYLDQVEACHGARLRAIAEAMLKGGAIPSLHTEPASFPLNCRIANTAEAIIVHSEWSRSRLADIAPAVPIKHINHHVTPDAAQQPPSRNKPKERGVEIASFGHITTRKGIERTLRVLATLRKNYRFHYTLVGQPDDFNVSELVRSYALTDRVTITGYVSLVEFKNHIAATDIAINLREHTVGETSGSVCRAMAAGVPVIVSDVGWFTELPCDSAIKIEAGENADSLLHAYLVRLIEDASLRARIGANARRYIRTAHAIAQSAEAYINFIRETVVQRERRRFIRRVSAEVALLGIRTVDESFLRSVASEIARLAPSEVFDSKDAL